MSGLELSSMRFGTKMMTNVPDIDNPTCAKCKLYQGCRHPFMDAEQPDAADILIIGEAPGRDEDRLGAPFVGESGTLLRTALRDLGCDNVAFTNVVRCRPPENKISTGMIKACRQFALDDIERINPQLVLLMGNSSLSGILGESGITNWNGVPIDKGGRRYVPLYHPAYILRNMSMLDEWLEALNAALSSGDDARKANFLRIIPKTLGEVEAMATRLAESEYIAYDTEVSHLDAYHPDNLLLSASFAMDGFSWSVPLSHPGHWWDTTLPKKFSERKVTEQERVIGICLEILSKHSGYVIGHNTKFDQMQTFAQAGCWFDIGGDTMLLSHLIDSRQGIHGLKRLAGIYLGMYEYEAELQAYIKSHKEADPRRGGSYAEVPLDILLPYGAMDAEATWSLHPILYAKLSDKQKVLYDQVVIAASDALGRMQCNGMVIDEYIAYRYMSVYQIRQREILDAILGDKKVQRYIDDRRLENKRFSFNPASFQQKADLFFKYYKIPAKDLPRTDSGQISTSSKNLRHLEDKYPILNWVRMYNLLGKMLGTYLEPAATGAWNGGDGKARTTFNMHGTISGRLSSSQPFNSQNIPTPEKEPGTLLEYLPIKNIFTHHFINLGRGLPFETRYGDGVVMSADYSGMELRCFTAQSKCEPMLAIHRSGRDFHSMVAAMSIYQKMPQDVTDADIATITKPVRYRYKWTNWTLLYGGDEYTLHRLYDIPLDEAEQTVRRYYHTFPQVKQFMETCVEFAEEHGYIESPYGRRVYLPYINDNRDKGKRNKNRREAVNVPIQSGASETLTATLPIIIDKLETAGLRAILSNTVHDSVVLSVPKNEILETAELIVDVMENITVYGPQYYPGVDFSWLTCPLKADVDVGTHYGSMIELGKWMELNG